MSFDGLIGISECPDTSRAVLYVHVIDDDEAFRSGIARMLNLSGLNTVCYTSAEAYLRSDASRLPGCVLLDVAMPGQNGLTMFEEVAGRDISPAVIFLTGAGNVSDGVRAMKSGAVDFLTKPVAKDDLLRSVHEALAIDIKRRPQGEKLEMIRRRYLLLQERERQVFAGIAEGKLNKQLAPIVGVCERTVKALRAQVMVKMEAATLPELIRAALLLGVTSSGDVRSPDVRSRPAYRALHDK